MRKIFSVLLILAMLMSCIPAGAYYSYGKDLDFTDMDYTHWGYYYIKDCVNSGIMKGTSDTTFSPDSTISVAEIITIAVRLAGIKTVSSGKNWYDGAVNAAIHSGIIKEGQFDSFTREASRAEVAGMLGVVKPESSYKAINNIYAIYDVNEMTPYCGEIYKLYRAGILTGSGNSAAFKPYENITRAETAALVARLLDEGQRRNFTIVESPSDYTVKTTDKRLNIGGVYGYGIVEIGGKYFMMPELFKATHGEVNGRILTFNKESKDYYLDIKKGYPDDVAYAIDYSFAMPSGLVMGTAELAPEILYFNYKTACYNSLYTIDGKFHLVSLEAIGAYEEGNDFVLPVERYASVIHKEVDMVGNALASLQRASAKDTARAIHDYIVNTITYDPTVMAYSGITQAKLDEVQSAKESAEATYNFDNNITLASKYGVCHNYALLINEMYLRSGIPCFYVVGETSGSYGLEGHAWNMVYVNGEWLFVDATWDDPVSKKPQLSHSYFLVGVETMARSRIWDGYPMPEEYDPEWEKIDPNNITSADMYRKCLVAQIAMGKTNFSLRPVKSGAYGGNMSAYLYSESYFWSMSCRYNSKTGAYDYVVE